MTALQDSDECLSISELRRVLLSTASADQLAVAAASLSTTVGDYLERMSKDEWGDNLIIVLAAAYFGTPITIIGKGSVRTYHPDGQEEVSAPRNSVWIAHRFELHYYGIIRKPDAEELARRRDLGLLYECPLCTDAVTCGTCMYVESPLSSGPRK